MSNYRIVSLSESDVAEVELGDESGANGESVINGVCLQYPSVFMIKITRRGKFIGEWEPTRSEGEWVFRPANG
jgi:hypothetical protein